MLCEASASHFDNVNVLAISCCTTLHFNLEGATLAQDWQKEYAASVTTYINDTNQFLGLTGFTVGVSCLGKPSLYALVGMGLLLLVWGYRFRAYRHRLDALRAVGHEAMKPSALLRSCLPAVAGWIFLGAVALGVLKL